MRGEHVSAFCLSLFPSGSSPHAWGTCEIRDITFPDIGSSPHAWGTCNPAAILEAAGRFIPTCVGNMLRERVGGEPLGVHPHMRGEHNVSLSGAQREVGSSPHAWGTFRGASLRGRSGRFIPTCVGNIKFLSHLSNTNCGSSPHAWGTYGLARHNMSKRTVHPHMRGEHVWDCVLEVCAQRFIPTCVGNIP